MNTADKNHKNMPEKILNPENREGRGHNVIIVLNLIRHAEKKSFDGPITEEGRKDAEKLGRGRNAKVFYSGKPRTKQTAEAIAKDSPYAPRERKKLIGQFSPEFLQDYEEIVAKHGGDESAALQIYLDSENERPDDETQSSKEISKQLAGAVQCFIDMSGQLENGSRANIDLISQSGTIEHLLVDLLEEERGDFVKRSGGALKPLEGIKLIINRNTEGEAHISLEFRGITKEIDPAFLQKI